MKNKALIISLIVILSIVSILLIGSMVFLLSGNRIFNFTSYKTYKEIVVNETYDIDFESIDVDTTASDIEIKKSSSNNFQVIVYGEKDKTKIETINNTLKIVIDERTCVGLCINVKISKIEIYVPTDYNKDITINNKFGDIKVTELLNANINIEEDCGDVTVQGANNLVVKNNYGDISINKANIVTIEEDCGDVKVGTVNEITVSNNLGDIKIKEVNGYLNLENSCGDIDVDYINLNRNSYIKDNLGDIELGSTNEIFIDAKTSLGNVRVNNNYNKSDITLKVENDCGDIKVNN